MLFIGEIFVKPTKRGEYDLVCFYVHIVFHLHYAVKLIIRAVKQLKLETVISNNCRRVYLETCIFLCVFGHDVGFTSLFTHVTLSFIYLEDLELSLFIL